MAIEPGTICLVRYQGFAEFHQRLVTCWLTGAEYMVVTPDFECFPEELSLANPDLTAVRVPRKGEEALGVPQQRVHSFRQALSSDQVERLIDEGGRLAAIERVQRGLPALHERGGMQPSTRSVAGGGQILQAPISVPIATASSVAVGSERTSPPGGVWIVDEPIEKYDIGAEVEFPPGAVDVGGQSIVAIDGASAVLRFMPGGESISAYVAARKSLLADDARIISPCRGEGVRSFAEAARDMLHDQDIKFKLSGPRTAFAYLDRLVSTASGGMIARHDKWVRESGVHPADKLVYEHQNLCRMIDYAVIRDGINVRNCEAFELAFRRLQLQEEAVAENW
eukprot:6479345-Amphidinium_carterae.1